MSIVRDALATAGITINGSNPWDMRVLDDRLENRILAQGTLGLGEAYMDGWWECERLDMFFDRVIRARLHERIPRNLRVLLSYIKAQVVNMQSKSRAFHIGQFHYDLGNLLYEKMLDHRMIYSCGYWKDATTLDDAQEAKLDLICRKLQLKPGLRVLDIGCGWGGLARFMAEKYGVTVIGITVSKEQAALARTTCAGLPVEIRLQDYRDLDEQFDRIVSVGMFEHVGLKNYRTFMKVARRCLNDDGLFLLHTIGSEARGGNDPWIHRYVFPNGRIPAVREIAAAAEQLFVMEDWHNFGTYYDNTLMAWEENFRRAWSELKQKYDERFYRMWRYYLLSCAGSFRARSNELWQVVFSKNGVLGGYASVR